MHKGQRSVIRYFEREFDFLSNFHPVPHGVSLSEEFCPGGPFYPALTVEHVFAASKSNYTGARATILLSASPGLAKRRGRELTLRPDWEEIKDAVMLHALRQKFKLGTELARKLLATRDAILIEGNNWHDTVWGMCQVGQGRWIGENRLGKFLELVREELKLQEAAR